MSEHDDRVVCAAGLEYAQHLRGHGRIGDADQLPHDVTGVRQRSEKVEHRRHTEFTTGRCRVPKSGVKTGSEAESDSGLAHAASDPFGSELEGYSQRLENIG